MADKSVLKRVGMLEKSMAGSMDALLADHWAAWKDTLKVGQTVSQKAGLMVDKKAGLMVDKKVGLLAV
jgi:hypothetical protein